MDRIGAQYASDVFDTTAVAAGPYHISNNNVSFYNNGFNVFSIGDSIIYANEISPVAVPGSTNGIGIFLTGNPGGAKLIGNKINAGGFGYAAGVAVTASVSDGDFIAVGNSIEQASQECFLFAHTGGTLFGNVQLTSNQCSTSGRSVYFPDAASWVSAVDITSNIFFSVVSGVDIVNADILNISSNVFYGTGVGINLGAAVTHCGVGFNNFGPSLSIQIQDASAACKYAQVTTSKPTYP